MAEHVLAGRHIVVSGGVGPHGRRVACQPLPLRQRRGAAAAAAQAMLGQVLAAEHPAIRVHTLMLKSLVATRARPLADGSWVTCREVGAMTAWLFTDAGRLTGGTTIQLTPKVLP